MKNVVRPFPPVGGLPAPPAMVARELVRMEHRLLALEKDMRRSIARAAPDYRESARNLVHYIALRQHDLRELQSQLSRRGLSSLGRSESCVMESLLQVSRRAHESLALQGDAAAAKKELARLEKGHRAVTWEEANRRLHKHTHAILGPRPDDRHIYIMVTAPSAKEADCAWMVKMLNAGMNVLRINCAHEKEREWGQMIQALRAARTETRRPCRVLMDLAGPKIRTGPIAVQRKIITWRPSKDEIGNVIAPARVIIGRAATRNGSESPSSLHLRNDSFARVRKGDELRFRDARGKKRTLVIEELEGDRLVAISTERAYVLDQVKAQIHRGETRIGHVTLEVGGNGDASIDIKTGDALVLTSRPCRGQSPRRDSQGRIDKPGVIGCTLASALDHLTVGHRVLFDDGRIQAVVERIDKKGKDYWLRVVRTHKETVRLHAEKGINLPDTLTTVSSLTADDRRALKFVVRYADAVSLSFVRRPDDVRALHTALDRLKQTKLGIVLKIETRAGFENLPAVLIEGLRRPPLAVMIARGDLAVEVGFERLAELQEEILWLCEAAHVPAIWATQVLDTLARTGVPSRAEVTDAAASVAAECVMLNKGPFVDEAVRVLADILSRMEQHHYKKRSLFRQLRVSSFAEQTNRGAEASVAPL